MRTRTLAFAAIFGLLITALGAPVLAGVVQTTRMVDDDGMAAIGDCDAATSSYTLIQDAVNASAPGDTVFVCPGTYAETVDVPIQLRLLGANNDQRATDCAERANESIVQGPGDTHASAFYLHANGIVLDGFYISTDPATTDVVAPAGVFTSPAFSGYLIRANIFADNRIGLYLQSSGPTRTYVKTNCFRDNNVAGAASGTGIYSDQGLHAASIWKNGFRRQDSAAITIDNFINGNENIAVLRNVSRHDNQFLGLWQGRNFYVSRNSVGNPAGSGSAAIRVGNDVNAVQILDNVVRGPFFAGIRVAERADGVLVKRDTVRRAQTGIDVETSIPGGAHVRLNTVADSVSYGVHLHAVASEDLIKENTIGGSGTFDCFDESTGSGSAGTADKWLANTGATSSPAGLCRP